MRFCVQITKFQNSRIIYHSFRENLLLQKLVPCLYTNHLVIFLFFFSKKRAKFKVHFHSLLPRIRSRLKDKSTKLVSLCDKRETDAYLRFLNQRCPLRVFTSNKWKNLCFQITHCHPFEYAVVEIVTQKSTINFSHFSMFFIRKAFSSFAYVNLNTGIKIQNYLIKRMFDLRLHDLNVWNKTPL